MGSKWKKAKAALGLNLCVYVPRTHEDGESVSSHALTRHSDAGLLNSSRSPAGQYSGTLPVAPATPKSGIKLSKSSSRSSKKICAICLVAMKPGHGHAIFTAECTHSFHFNCIASNVKHGNQVCPVCRAKWNEVPFQVPKDLPDGKTKINPLDWPQDGAWMSVLRRLPRNDTNRQNTSFPPIPEPSVFNDDEALDRQALTANKFPSTRDTGDKISTRPMDIKLYPEVSAVRQSLSQNNFSVLIHLKAPVISSQCNSDRSQCNLPQILQTSRAPVDLVTVLDVSGSMAGTKLALLKRAMGFVIQNLGPSDRLSVIAFSSSARRCFPLCRMTDSGRQQALQAVNSLVSNGGTNIAEGLRKGAKVMEERKEKNPVGSIILLSDGQDTYSMSCKDRAQTRPDYQSLLPFSVRGNNNSGFHIPVHAFGFGTDHDAASMHSIAEASSGTFSFIEAEGVIQDAFAQCIGGLLSVVVQDLRVGIECVHPDIHLGPLKAGSYATQVMDDARTGFINVGDLYADEVRDFLVSINVPVDHASKETTLLKVNGVYRDPVSKETLTLDGIELKIQRPEVVQGQVVSVEVDRQRNRVQAAAAMAEAQIAAERGDLSGAVQILQCFRRVLSETTSALLGDRLCVALDAELKEMEERMANRHTYEVSGRAYVLSGLSSHSWQRATARGDSTDSTSLVHAYQTPSMVDMVSRSQILGRPSSQSPVRPPRSCPVQPQPR
ncbi:E3 ubiquitin-protein ligase wav3 [Thalictrum thalictroides]|uniref:E3 ubiquitin-protein ligase wav3 n=1 Tax=Thalictrum thalictroides TaxID=46969 RepID=A0A7J6WEE5_THATH|nr:E3 ubiquitin-protein ligase wav3 [Thalictrum thalictroides]